ncbi:MAG: hypothetical protein AAGJ46_15290 [Planctomycetota bacterium]
MLPFLVQCETCHAKLRVRDPGVVGQVHACLKCGSMVQLTPPEGWAIGDHGDEGGGSVDAPNPVAEAPTTEAPAATEASAAALPVGGPAGHVGAANPQDIGLAIGSEGEAKLTASLAPPPPLSPAEAIGRWAATAAAIGAGALAVGIGVAAWWVQSDQPPTPVQVATAGGLGDTTPAGFDQPDPLDESLSGLAPEADFAANEPKPEQPAAAEPPLVTEPAPVEPPADAAPLPSDPPVGLPPVAMPEPDEPSEADIAIELPPIRSTPIDAAPTEPAPVEPANDPPPAVSGPFDPLAFDPSSLDLILTRKPAKAAEDAAPKGPEGPPESDLDTRLAANERLPAVGDDLDARLDGLADDARAVVRRGPTAPPKPLDDEPLSIVVPELAVASMPLDTVCRLLGRIAGTPVTLPPDVLAEAAVRADKPVAVRAMGATVGELFEQALEPLRLELVDEGRGLTVARLGGSQQRRGKYLVRDLAPGDATTLADLIATVLPDLPAAITPEGERLVVDGAVSAHLQVAILCERLRKARGLDPRSRYPRELLLAEAAESSVRSLLDRRTTFTFVEFTPVDQVFDYWRRATGLVILVDWRALADAEVRPDSTFACSVVDRPWRESLSAVLEGIGLTWRVVGDGTLQITTPAAAAESPRIELRQVANQQAAELLAERLDALAWAYEPEGRLAVLRLP